VNGEIGEIDEKEIGSVERGVRGGRERRRRARRCGGLGDGLPLAEAFSEIGMNERSAAVCREKDGRREFPEKRKDSHRVTEDTERRSGRRARLLSAAKEAAGRLFD